MPFFILYFYEAFILLSIWRLPSFIISMREGSSLDALCYRLSNIEDPYPESLEKLDGAIDSALSSFAVHGNAPVIEKKQQLAIALSLICGGKEDLLLECLPPTSSSRHMKGMDGGMLQVLFHLSTQEPYRVTICEAFHHSNSIYSPSIPYYGIPLSDHCFHLLCKYYTKYSITIPKWVHENIIFQKLLLKYVGYFGPITTVEDSQVTPQNDNIKLFYLTINDSGHTVKQSYASVAPFLLSSSTLVNTFLRYIITRGGGMLENNEAQVRWQKNTLYPSAQEVVIVEYLGSKGLLKSGTSLLNESKRLLLSFLLKDCFHMLCLSLSTTTTKITNTSQLNTLIESTQKNTPYDILSGPCLFKLTLSLINGQKMHLLIPSLTNPDYYLSHVTPRILFNVFKHINDKGGTKHIISILSSYELSSVIFNDGIKQEIYQEEMTLLVQESMKAFTFWVRAQLNKGELNNQIFTKSMSNINKILSDACTYVDLEELPNEKSVYLLLLKTVSDGYMNFARLISMHEPSLSYVVRDDAIFWGIDLSLLPSSALLDLPWVIYSCGRDIKYLSDYEALYQYIISHTRYAGGDVREDPDNTKNIITMINNNVRMCYTTVEGSMVDYCTVWRFLFTSKAAYFLCLAMIYQCKVYTISGYELIEDEVSCNFSNSESTVIQDNVIAEYLKCTYDIEV